MYYEKLKSLIAPPKSPVYIGTENMHKKIDERLGIKLPDDYYKIIETYGAGSFHNCNKLFDLVVFNPYINDSNLNLFTQIKEYGESYRSLREDCGNQSNICEYSPYNSQIYEGYPFNYYPEKNGLIIWGWIDGGDFSFYYLPTTENWSIVVYDDIDGYMIFEIGIAEFIYKLICGEIVFEDLKGNGSNDKFLFQKFEETEE